MTENTEKKHDSAKPAKTRDEVVEMIGKQHLAMLTTLENDRMVSRPLGLQKPDADGTLWFFVRTDSEVALQVRADSRVNVSLADGDYLSISGHGEVVHDPAKNEELWNPFVESWMQCAPTDEQCSLVKVTPDTIAYWDTPNAVASFTSMVKGLVTDQEPNVGETGVVEA